MAENNIKDFVMKQTAPLNIGVPKTRVEAPVPVATQPAKPATRMGRPRSEFNRVKVSIYIPEEYKTELIKIQHHNFRPSLNDVLMEAISDIIKKYE